MAQHDAGPFSTNTNHKYHRRQTLSRDPERKETHPQSRTGLSRGRLSRGLLQDCWSARITGGARERAARGEEVVERSPGSRRIKAITSSSRSGPIQHTRTGIPTVPKPHTPQQRRRGSRRHLLRGPRWTRSSAETRSKRRPLPTRPTLEASLPPSKPWSSRPSSAAHSRYVHFVLSLSFFHLQLLALMHFPQPSLSPSLPSMITIIILKLAAKWVKEHHKDANAANSVLFRVSGKAEGVRGAEDGMLQGERGGGGEGGRHTRSQAGACRGRQEMHRLIPSLPNSSALWPL